MEENEDPHKILGVEKSATFDQIKDAYREKALKCHPKVDSSPEAAKNFEKLANAYNSLTEESSETRNTFGSFF